MKFYIGDEVEVLDEGMLGGHERGAKGVVVHVMDRGCCGQFVYVKACDGNYKNLNYLSHVESDLMLIKGANKRRYDAVMAGLEYFEGYKVDKYEKD